MALGTIEQIDDLQGSILRALASSHRLRLIHLLAAGERTVGEIGEALCLTQAAASQHLAALRAVGVVEATRDGRTVSYRLADDDIAIACGLMRDVLMRRLSRLGDLAAAAAAPQAFDAAVSNGRSAEVTRR